MFYWRITEAMIDHECNVRPGLGRMQAYRVIEHRMKVSDKIRRYGRLTVERERRTSLNNNEGTNNVIRN